MFSHNKSEEVDLNKYVKLYVNVLKYNDWALQVFSMFKKLNSQKLFKKGNRGFNGLKEK